MPIDENIEFLAKEFCEHLSSLHPAKMLVYEQAISQETLLDICRFSVIAMGVSDYFPNASDIAVQQISYNVFIDDYGSSRGKALEEALKRCRDYVLLPLM